MRVLWLLMGIGIAIQSVLEKNFLILLPGLYFVFGAIANIGCFAGSCATGYAGNNNKSDAATEIEFEEVQSKK